MASYVDSDDLTARYDSRTVAQLASDTNAPVALSNLGTDPNVSAAVDDAEGEVVAALLVGGRYASDDLSSLTGTAQAYLKRIICEIAMLRLLQRRPKLDPRLYEQLEKVRETHLKTLQDGKAIFGGNDADIEASRAVVDGISTSDMININSIRVRKERYFPRPELPRGR